MSGKEIYVFGLLFFTILSIHSQSEGTASPISPSQTNENNSSTRVLELRQRLTKLLHNIRQRRQQDSGKKWNAEDRQWQRESFAKFHTLFSELLSNGHSINFARPLESLVISSNDGSWLEVIEYQVSDDLDVNDQMIRQEFPLNPNSPCPTVLSARFQSDSRLVLSQQENHVAATNVIYGIRCRLCDRRLGPYNINYVGQSERSAHKRVCDEHSGTVEKLINNEPNDTEGQPPRTMYNHVVQHFRNDLPQDLRGSLPRDAFRLMMEVILLPIGSDVDLRSWECFWQFFCHCRKFFWGWSQRKKSVPNNMKF